jgi:hypothetical protein
MSGSFGGGTARGEPGGFNIGAMKAIERFGGRLRLEDTVRRLGGQTPML